MMPDWDIHPEMVTHTWVIDTKTGPALSRSASARYMENWDWTDGKSVDELAEYMAYALRMLKNAGLAVRGDHDARRVRQRRACRNWRRRRSRRAATCIGPRSRTTSGTCSPTSRASRRGCEYASGLDGPIRSCVVSIIGCTGDWFGGWDGLEPGSVDQFITADLKSGRLVEVIDQRRAGDHRLPLAGDVFQRRGDRASRSSRRS